MMLLIKFFLLLLLNYAVINLSTEIDLYQLGNDFLFLFPISYSSLAISTFFAELFVCISVVVVTLILIQVFRPFIEIYLLHYFKYSFYLLINLLAVSTVYIVYRIYGYDRVYLLLYIVSSSVLQILFDKFKR